jgi:DNA-binding winged helix-turn-helix (wHTH) protein
MRRLRVQDRLVFPDFNMIVFNGASVHVEPKAMDVLLELADKPGEVVSRTDILQSVWGGRFVCEDVVTNAISLLRRALGDEGRDGFLIETVPKRGYRLTSSVAQEMAEEAIVKMRPAASPLAHAPQGMNPDIDAKAVARATDLNSFLLRVRHLRQEETVASLKSACAYSEEIIRQEPNCAAAYVELSLSLFLLEKLGVARREEIEPKVRWAVDRALHLDERAGLSLVCLAKLEYRYDWRWHEAERHFRQALEADPQDADVFREFSLLLSVMRRFDESLNWIHKACVLDPLSPAVRLQAGHAYYSSSQWSPQYQSRRKGGHRFARSA